MISLISGLNNKENADMQVNRLKTSYQKNILMGMAVSVILLCSVCLLFLDLSPEDVIILNTEISDIYIVNNDVKTRNPKPAMYRVGGRPKRRYSGFLGFGVKFKILTENWQSQIEPSDPILIRPDNPIVLPDDLSYSLIPQDSDTGVYLPDGLIIYSEVSIRPRISIATL